uniref:Uncharacterized protein n=1 Tax=Arundo donax TaxID=35708 RepID=A0A0A9CF48_ARUDO
MQCTFMNIFIRKCNLNHHSRIQQLIFSLTHKRVSGKCQTKWTMRKMTFVTLANIVTTWRRSNMLDPHKIHLELTTLLRHPTLYTLHSNQMNGIIQ